MPNEIDDLIAQVSEKPKKETYQPARGEEAIFAAPEKNLLDYLAPLLPFYSQFTGQTPWQSPETAMEAIGWGSGGLMRGSGMVKGAIPKGSSSISKALSEIGSELFGKGGVPATIEKGSLPAAIERGFTHRPGETVNVASKRGRIPKELGTAEPKQLPQYAGPTAPAIPQPYAPQSWRERTFPGTMKNAQDVIEDLFRESLRAKGMID